ncbi:unnamed protein product [Penicillium viridicatum]
MVAPGRSGPPPGVMGDIKTGNKLRRKMNHVKRKRAKDAARREERYAFKKEEAKNPKLKEERLRRNIPLTLERKRVWNEADNDTEETGLGLSVDVERIKRAKKEEEDELNRPLEEGEDDSEAPESDNESVDSMLESDNSGDEDEDEEKDGDKDASRGRKKTSLRTATERATSPTQSTRSTNLSLAPEALAAKFPTLFTEGPPPTPKILITTGLNSTLHDQAETLTEIFPNSVYIRRNAHRYSHKFSIREISKFATNRNFTTVVVLNEDQKRPSGLTMVHLPVGPTFHFTISNWIEGKRLPGHGRATEHWPELILNNFRTPLGLLTAHLFRSLFPPQPEFEGRQVVTLHNQRDYIFVRRHRYVFREKRETEKAVVGADGKEMLGVEGIRTGLQELGPRFTLKLRRVDKGIQRASGQEWEWKGGMEKTRTLFQLTRRPRRLHVTNETHSMHSPIDLPTIAEIETLTDLLSIRTNAIKVVRVKERFAVKIGYAIPPLEAENMKYIAANSKIPVPKVYANIVDPETQKRYVVMDFIPGADLQILLPSLTPAEKTKVSKRIKEAVDELRTISPPGYFGNLNSTPYIDGVLSTPDKNPIISGLYNDQEQMNQGILERLAQMQSPHYIHLLQEMVNRTLKNHRTVFTIELFLRSNCFYAWGSTAEEYNGRAKRDPR